MFRHTRKQFNALSMIILAFVVSFISGCAPTKHMAINEETQTLDTNNESIALMTIKTSNQLVPAYQPEVYELHVWSTGKEKAQEYIFKVDEPYNSVEKEFYEYMASIKLPPGKYTFQQIYGKAYIGLAYGRFFVPIYADFELEPNQVVYIGHIEAVNKKRVYASEVPAGPSLPWVSQSVTGFRLGTFDVKIHDNYDKDLALFKQTYPVLGTCAVEKVVLTLGNQR